MPVAGMPGGGGSSVEIFLGLNVDKLKKGAKQGLVATKELFDKLEAQRQRLRNASIKLGAAFGAELAIVYKVTQAAAKQEQAEKNLTDAMMSHTGATEAQVDALKEQAAALQQVTKYGDEATMEAQAYLLTLGVTPDKIAKATEATLDMASALNMDLTAAARNVGKTMGGFAGELGEVIPELKNLTAEQLKAGMGIDLLADKFAGRAALEADSYGGRMEQIKNKIGDLWEVIGFSLIPMIDKLVTRISPIIDKVATWVTENQKLLGVLLGIGIGGTGLLFALSSLGYLLAGLPSLLAAATGPAGILTLGVLALAGAIAYFNLKGQEIPGTLEEVRAEIEKQEQKLAQLERGYSGAYKESGRFTGGLESQEERMRRVAPQIEQTTEHLEKLRQAEQDLIKQAELEKKAQADAEAMRKATEAAKRHTAELQRQQELMERWGTKDPLVAMIRQRVMERERERDYMGLAIEQWQEMQTPLTEVEEKTFDIVKGIQEIPELANPAVEELNTMFQNLGAGMVNTFTSSFDTISKTEKRFLRAFGMAFIAMMLGTIRQFIITKVAEVTATALAEKAKALIMSPLSFGASLLAVAPIMAAAAGGIAALNAIEAGLMKKLGGASGFQFGGPVPADMVAKVHRDEIVYNPKYNTLDQFFDWLQQVAPGKMPAAAGAGAGTVNVFSNYYGPLMAQADLTEASRQQAEDIRQALHGLG